MTNDFFMFHYNVLKILQFFMIPNQLSQDQTIKEFDRLLGQILKINTVNEEQLNAYSSGQRQRIQEQKCLIQKLTDLFSEQQKKLQEAIKVSKKYEELLQETESKHGSKENEPLRQNISEEETLKRQRPYQWEKSIMHPGGEKKRKSSSENMRNNSDHHHQFSQNIDITNDKLMDKNGQLRIENFLSSSPRNLTPKKNEEKIQRNPEDHKTERKLSFSQQQDQEGLEQPERPQQGEPNPYEYLPDDSPQHPRIYVDRCNSVQGIQSQVSYKVFTKREVIKNGHNIFVPERAHYLNHYRTPVNMDVFVRYNWINMLEANFNNCKIYDVWLEIFCENFNRYPHIKALSLTCNPFITFRKQMLDGFTKLEYINFGQDRKKCKLTPESRQQVREYKREHPNVQVICCQPDPIPTWMKNIDQD